MHDTYPDLSQWVVCSKYAWNTTQMQWFCMRLTIFASRREWPERAQNIKHIHCMDATILNDLACSFPLDGI